VLKNWPITKVTDGPFGIVAFGKEPLDTCFLVSKNYWAHVQDGLQVRWIAPKLTNFVTTLQTSWKEFFMAAVDTA